MTYLKYFLASILLFLVLYFDQTFFGQIKVSHLWKIILFGYITILVVLYSKRGVFDSFLVLGTITGVSLLLNTTTLKGYQNDLLIFFDIYSLPLFYVYFKKTGEAELGFELLDKLVIYLTLFIILSNVPFLLRILDSPKDIDELLNSGEDSFSAITGLFHNASGASKVFTVATITIVAYRRRFTDKTRLYKLIWLSLVIIGGASVVFSFTRTGWALFVLGISFLLFYRSGPRSRLGSLMIISIILFLIVLLFKSNEILFNRLIGKKEGRTYTMNFNQISSGRGTLWTYSVDIINEASTSDLLFGYGSKGAFDEMQERTGNRTYPHNRFLEILIVGGLITFILYLFYLKKLFRLLPKLNKPAVSTLEKLPMTIFFIYFVSLFPSHGLGIYGNILFAAIIARAQLLNSVNNEEDGTHDNIPEVL